MSVAVKVIYLFLLLVPLVTANQLTDVHLERNGVPLEIFAPNKTQQATLVFSFDESQGSIIINLQEREYTVPAATCTPECRIPVTFIGEQDLTFTHTYSRLGSEFPDETHTITLTEGKLGRILDLNCSAPCTISGSASTNLTLTVENIHIGEIYVEVGRDTYKVDACDGSTCTLSVDSRCTDGNTLPLRTLHTGSRTSIDDAGNPLPEFSTSLLCDAQPPVLVEISRQGTGPQGIIHDQGTLTLNATIRETSNTIMKVNTASIQPNGTWKEVRCVKTINDFQECTLSVDNLITAEDISIPVSFNDAVGHVTETTLSLPSIHGVTNATANFFSASVTATTPEQINRVALQLALDNALDFPQKINYRLNRLTPGARVLHQEVDPTSCTISNGSSTIPAAALYDYLDVYDPLATWNAPNRLDAVFLELDANMIPDEVLVSCNLSLIVEKDGVVYENPEQEPLEWTLRMRNARLGTPGDAFLTKIDKQYGTLNNGYNKLIDTADTIFSTFAHFCQLQDMILLLSNEGLAIEQIAYLLPLQLGVSQQLAGVGSGLSSQMLSLSSSMWIQPGENIVNRRFENAMSGIDEGATEKVSGRAEKLRKFCDFVHCDTANRLQQAAEEGKDPLGLLAGDQSLAESIGTVDNAGLPDNPGLQGLWQDATTNLNTPDVGNSLVMCLATQCWPCTIAKLKEVQQIECGYLQCLKDQALDGSSIAACELARGTKMCRFVTGEVFELPYARIGKNLAANINTIVQAPVVKVSEKLLANTCQGTEKEIGWVAFGCRLMKTLAYQKDFSSVTSYNFMYSYPYQADLCDAALCKGDNCELETNSYIERFLGRGDVGDTYRQLRLMEREREARSQRLQGVVNDVHEQAGQLQKDEELEITEEMERYARQHGARTEETQKEFFTKILTDCGENANPEQCSSNFEFMVVELEEEPTYEKLNDYLNQVIPQGQRQAYLGFTDFYENIVTNDDYTYNDEHRWIPRNCGTPDQKVTTSECESKWGYLERQTSSFGERVAVQVDGETRLCTADESDCVTYEVTKAQREIKNEIRQQYNAERFHQYVGGMATITFQYLERKGYLDFLKLSGYGEWGASFSENAADILDPEEWQANMCNPTGRYNELTQDDSSVYSFEQGTYRPVLTFAGEYLDIGEGYLHTMSFVAVSPEENQLQVYADGQQVGEPVQLLPEQRTSHAFSMTHEQRFREVCLVFNNSFEGNRRYCRDFVPNAYERGTPTTGALPEYGREDPYATLEEEEEQVRSPLPGLGAMVR